MLCGCGRRGPARYASIMARQTRWITLAVLLASLLPRAARAQDCGQFADVITAPSGRTGNHACDSDHDGAVKVSNYCYCSDCSIQPERCHRRGDPAFCACDPARQHCRPRPCIAAGTCDASAPSSYYWANDCSDSSRTRFPGNCEVCGDSVDDNCDGSTTDCPMTADLDGDGSQSPADCDDQNPSVYPGAVEVECNAIDEDCVGGDSCPMSPQDPDGDGYAAPADCDEGDAAVHPGAPDTCGDQRNSDCDPAGLDCPGDQDLDGFSYPVDCDDERAEIHPGALELCGDGIDQDCAGGDRACVQDLDRDGFDASSAGGADCEDLDSAVHPGAREVCGDAIDQDCSGADVSCAEADWDLDGHLAIGFGGDDCDDRDDSLHPGAPELCGDGLDSNCDRLPDVACGGELDRDRDGFAAAAFGDGDCNDLDSRISPLAAEVCGDGVDNNCDGVADEGCVNPIPSDEETLRFINDGSGCGCDDAGAAGRPGLTDRAREAGLSALVLLGLSAWVGRRRPR